MALNRKKNILFSKMSVKRLVRMKIKFVGGGCETERDTADKRRQGLLGSERHDLT